MTGYPGNKAKWLVPSGYSVVYDLFMGGGGFSLAARRSNPDAVIYGAESNPLQRAILQGGVMVDLGLELAREIAPKLKRHIHPDWDGEGAYHELYSELRQALADDWITYVKEPFNKTYFDGEVTVDAIAAQILCLTYGYNSNLRTSSKGLNISSGANKLLGGLPTLPPPIKAEIYPDFRDLRITPGSLVLIDPPYWLPRRMQRTHKRCTACYADHEPYSDSSLQVYFQAVQMALNARAAAIIVAGYWSIELYSLLCAISEGYGMECIHHGVLARQGLGKKGHKHNRKNGKRSVNDDLPAPVDYEWALTLPTAPVQQKQLVLFS